MNHPYKIFLFFFILINLFSLESSKASVLTNYPPNEIWRLFVDGVLQAEEGGFEEYEKREPGSLRANFEALNYLVSNLETLDLNIELLHKIHRYVSQGEKPLYYPEGFDFIPGQWKDSKYQGSFFMMKEVYPYRHSREGIKDFFDFIFSLVAFHSTIVFYDPKNHSEYYYGVNFFAQDVANDEKASMLDFVEKFDSFKYITPSPIYDEDTEAISQTVVSFMFEYKKNEREARSDKEKYLAIISLVQKLERLHPYIDYNGRTFANHLFIFLCLKNNLMVPTFYDPNVFDFLTSQEILIHVLRGVKFSSEIIKKSGEGNFFSYQSIPLEQFQQRVDEETFNSLMQLVQTLKSS